MSQLHIILTPGQLTVQICLNYILFCHVCFRNAGKKAAISFTYEDSTDPKPAKVDKEKKTDPDDSEESDFDEVDLGKNNLLK